MPNVTTVGITSGVPTSGTGTVSTLDNLVGTAGTGSSNVLTVQGNASGTAVPVSVASIPSHAVTNAGTFATQSASTQSGTWTVQPGNTANTTAWKVDGSAVTQPVSLASVPSHAVTNAGTFAVQATLSAGSTAIAKAEDVASADADVGVPAMMVRKATPANTSGTDGDYEFLQGSAGRLWVSADDPYSQYETVAASQTAQALGATGATGDYLAGVLVFPGTAGCGVVTVLDNATTIGTFAGGGTTALPSLVPFMIPIGLFSTSGAWKVTTGANVTCVGIGKFT